MTAIYENILSSFVFAGAISLDALAAAMAYGAEKIKIPLSSSVIISLVCTGCLAVSLFFGYSIRGIISQQVTQMVGMGLLCLIGLFKLIDSGLKAYIRKNPPQKQIDFSLFHLQFVLTVYADPQKADRDHSRTLSPMEAVSLALALSIDGLAAGFGGGLISFHSVFTLIFTCFFTWLCVVVGARLGKRLGEKLPFDLSFLSGIILIVLALLKFK